MVATNEYFGELPFYRVVVVVEQNGCEGMLTGVYPTCWCCRSLTKYFSHWRCELAMSSCYLTVLVGDVCKQCRLVVTVGGVNWQCEMVYPLAMSVGGVSGGQLAVFINNVSWRCLLAVSVGVQVVGVTFAWASYVYLVVKAHSASILIAPSCSSTLAE